ncbi:hypothetical protein CC79DRAFT_1050950 [Sarocladium strictum]
MNPNVGMANMNPMGGPVGGAPVPMMNNGPMNPQQAAAAAAAANANRQQPGNDNQRTHLNTYIYEYFIRYGMYDCARALVNSDQPVNVQKDGAGNKGNTNGTTDDAMDTDSKDDIDSKLPEDLPLPKLPIASESSFLYEWFCVFWDIYNAQRLKGPNNTVNQYVAHTQQQSRLRQNQQQDLLRQMRPEMAQQHYQAQIMRNVQNMNGAMAAGMNMKQNNLARAAMANNQNNPQVQMLQQQAKQNQMQRDPSSMNGSQGDRPSSPASGENAPSPSKRQRVEAPFNPNQPGAVMGRGQAMGGQQMTQSVAAAHHMLAMNGINPNSLNAAQLHNFVSSGPAAQQKSIATYSQNLQQQQGAQMGNKQMPNGPGPQNQGSPMQQGPDGNMLNNYYNPGDMAGAAGMRPGAPGQQPPGSNHALQDYQMQLMLLEQQNKKRLMMARQEQDSMGGVSREGGPGPSPQAVPTGPNGQPFPDTSPQAMRTGTSPNPSEQMKRGTPQMNNNSGIPSPVPEGGQSRGSPNSMNFMGNHVDPKMAPHFFNGVDGNNMAAAQAQMNGMRPPGAHPGQPFNGQMNPQQLMAARQGQPGPNGQQWQQGPNGQMQPQNMQQGPQPGQAQGTPQQRSMPPPSAPAQVAANANRTTASPQQAAAAPPTPNQGNKAAPKKKESKAAKEKRAANKKSNQNLNNASATPASENAGEGEAAAPATPITPVNPGFNKGQQGGSGPQATGTAAPAVPAPAPVPPPGADLMQNGLMDSGFGNMGGIDAMGFADPITTSDVLNDFDFDSFLHDGDTDNPPFDFNNAFVDTNEIPAE